MKKLSKNLFLGSSLILLGISLTTIVSFIQANKKVISNKIYSSKIEQKLNSSSALGGGGKLPPYNGEPPANTKDYYAIPTSYLSAKRIFENIFGFQGEKQLSAEEVTNMIFGGLKQKRYLLEDKARKLILDFKFYNYNTKTGTFEEAHDSNLTSNLTMLKKEFYNKISVEISRFNKEEGWFEMDVFSEYSIWRLDGNYANQKKWVGMKPSFTYNTIRVDATKWDNDKNGKFETVNTNTALSMIRTKENRLNILPSQLTKDNFNEYLAIEMVNVPQNAKIVDIRFTEIDNQLGSLTISFKYDKIFRKGRMDTGLNKLFTYRIDREFGVDLDNDGHSDQGNSLWIINQKNDLTKASLIPAKIVDFHQNDNIANGRRYIGDFLDIVAINGVAGASYKYTITHRDPVLGVIDVDVIVDKYKENQKIINAEKIAKKVRVTGFGKDVDNNNVLDGGTTTWKFNKKADPKIFPSQVVVGDALQTSLSNFIQIIPKNPVNNTIYTYKILKSDDTNGTLEIEILVDKYFFNGVIENNKILTTEISGFAFDLDHDQKPDNDKTTQIASDITINLKNELALNSEIQNLLLSSASTITNEKLNLIQNLLWTSKIFDKYIINPVENINPLDSVTYDRVIKNDLNGAISFVMTLKKSFSNGTVILNTLKTNVKLIGFKKHIPFAFSEQSVLEKNYQNKTYKIFLLEDLVFNNNLLNRLSFNNDINKLESAFYAMINKMVAPYSQENKTYFSDSFTEKSISIIPSSTIVYDDSIMFSVQLKDVFGTDGTVIDENNKLTFHNFVFTGFSNIKKKLIPDNKIVFKITNSDYDSNFFKQEKNSEILKSEIINNFTNIFRNSTLIIENENLAQIPSFSLYYSNKSLEKAASNQIFKDVYIKFDIDFSLFKPAFFGENNKILAWKLTKYKRADFIRLPLEKYNYLIDDMPNPNPIPPNPDPNPPNPIPPNPDPNPPNPNPNPPNPNPNPPNPNPNPPNPDPNPPNPNPNPPNPDSNSLDNKGINSNPVVLPLIIFFSIIGVLIIISTVPILISRNKKNKLKYSDDLVLEEPNYEYSDDFDNENTYSHYDQIIKSDY